MSSNPNNEFPSMNLPKQRHGNRFSFRPDSLERKEKRGHPKVLQETRWKSVHLTQFIVIGCCFPRQNNFTKNAFYFYAIIFRSGLGNVSKGSIVFRRLLFFNISVQCRSFAVPRLSLMHDMRRVLKFVLRST